MKGALTAPSTHRPGSLQWGLSGGTRGGKGKTQKCRCGDSPARGITLEQGDSDPKEDCVSILHSSRVLRAGASRSQGHHLKEQLLLPSTWLDPDQRASGCSGRLSQLPHKSGGGGGGAAAGTSPAPPPHQHLSGIYRHTDHTQNPS